MPSFEDTSRLMNPSFKGKGFGRLGDSDDEDEVFLGNASSRCPTTFGGMPYNPLGTWYDPRTWEIVKKQQEEAKEKAGKEIEENRDAFISKLEILFTKVLVLNRNAAGLKKIGKLSYIDKSDYNKAVEMYNTLIDKVVKEFQKKGIICWYRFKKVKTTDMPNWNKYATWEKCFTPKKGLFDCPMFWPTYSLSGFSGIGFGAAPVVWVAVVIGAALTAWIGYSAANWFSSTDEFVSSTGKRLETLRMAEIDINPNLTPAQKVAAKAGVIEDIYRFIKGEQAPGISESIGKVVLWVGGTVAVAGAAYAAVKIYKAIKEKKKEG